MRTNAAVVVIVLAVSIAALPAVAADELPGEDKPIGDENVSFNASSGPNVTLGERTEFRNTNPYVNSNNITLAPWGYATSQGKSKVRINEFNGSWTNLTNIDAVANDLNVDPNDKEMVTISGGVTTVRYQKAGQMAVDDGQVDLVIGADSSGSITLRNLPASTTFSVGSTAPTPHDTVTTDASGTATIQISQTNGPEKVRFFTDGAPSISNANPDSKTVTQSQVDLEFDLSDRGFGSGTDEVEAIIYFDGSVESTQTLTSNQTVTTTVSNLKGGDHTWNVTLNDGYGSTTTGNFTFQSPDELFVYNETNPDQLVKQKDELRVRFFTDDGSQVVERTITDGTANLTGLPIDSRIVVTVRDSATNFSYRRIIISSIVDQQDIYLLPVSSPSNDIEFILDDQTGQFTPPSGTDLFVEKAITKDFNGDGSSETKYKTIVGDNFGASASFPAVLRDEERYRLRVRSDSGDTRVLGSYVATSSGTQTVTIGEVIVNGSVSQGTFFGADVVNVSGQQVIRFEYRDPNEQTSELDVEIVEFGNESNVLRANSTEVGPFGRYVETYPLPNNSTGKTWTVRYHATRDGKPDVGGSVQVGTQPEVLPPDGMDPRVLELMAYVAIVAITGLVVIVDDRIAAITATVTATAFDLIGAVDIPLVALGIAGAIALIYAVGRPSTA